jgi:hypothetical protein
LIVGFLRTVERSQLSSKESNANIFAPKSILFSQKNYPKKSFENKNNIVPLQPDKKEKHEFIIRRQKKPC